MSVLSLPKELVRKISGHFGPYELFEFSSTCRKYRELFKPDIFIFKITKCYDRNGINRTIPVRYNDLEIYELVKHINDSLMFDFDINIIIATAIIYEATNFLKDPQFQIEHPQEKFYNYFRTAIENDIYSEPVAIREFSLMKNLGYFSDKETLYTDLLKVFGEIRTLYIINKYYPKYRVRIINSIVKYEWREEEHKEIVRIFSQWKTFKPREFKIAKIFGGPKIFIIRTLLSLLSPCPLFKERLYDEIDSLITEKTYLNFAEALFKKYPMAIRRCAESFLRDGKLVCTGFVNLDNLFMLHKFGLYKFEEFNQILNVKFLYGDIGNFVGLVTTHFSSGLETLKYLCFKLLHPELLRIFCKDEFWIPKPEYLSIMEKSLLSTNISNTLEFLKIFADSRFSNLLSEIPMLDVYKKFVSAYRSLKK